MQNFDGVVGDVAIVARRCQYADFTHPYTESGLVMIFPVQKSGNKTLLFLKPFTRAVWILVAVISIYNGFVVWLIERNHWPELTGSTLHQTGTFFWLSFSSLFNLHVTINFLPKCLLRAHINTKCYFFRLLALGV